jgi:putative flippase GtrA
VAQGQGSTGPGAGDGDGERRSAVFLRFVVVNVLNTFLYWALYLLLLLVMPYFWANALALVIAVLAAYVLNARYAFRVRASRWSLVMYLITNGTTIVLRSAVVWVLVEHLSLAEGLAPPVAVAVTLPVAFILTKLAMTERPSAASRAPAAEPAPADTAPGTRTTS